MAALALVPAMAWAEPGPGGAALPDTAQKVGENRYRATGDWESVKKFYKSAYPPSTYPRKSIVNQPGVKAEHIVNPSAKGFEGLNIYQANDEVRIYIVGIARKKESKPAKRKEK